MRGPDEREAMRKREGVYRLRRRGEDAFAGRVSCSRLGSLSYQGWQAPEDCFALSSALREKSRRPLTTTGYMLLGIYHYCPSCCFLDSIYSSTCMQPQRSLHRRRRGLGQDCTVNLYHRPHRKRLQGTVRQQLFWAEQITIHILQGLVAGGTDLGPRRPRSVRSAWC